MVKPIVNLGETDPSGFQNAKLNLNGKEIDVKMKRTGGVFRSALQWLESKTVDRLTNNFVPLQVKGKTYYVDTKSLASELKQKKKYIVEAFKTERYGVLTSGGAANLKHAQLMARQKAIEADLGLGISREEYLDITRIAYQILGDLPPADQASYSMPIKLNNHKWAIGTVEGSDLKLSTLYGNKLGEGSFGSVMQMNDLFTLEPLEQGDAVIKQAISEQVEYDENGKVKKEESNSDTILKEAEVLQKLNPSGDLIGIQKPVRTLKVTKIESKGTSIFQENRASNRSDYEDGKTPLPLRKEATTLLIGPKYSTTFDFRNTGGKIPKFDYPYFGYQLFRGLEQIHEANLVHTDIKPENMLYGKDEELGCLAYIADFGSAIDYGAEEVQEPEAWFEEEELCIEGRTTGYCTYDDVIYRVSADSADERQTIDRAMDIFAACVTFCENVIGDYPFHEPSKSMYPSTLIEDVPGKLKSAGIDQSQIDILLQGLDKDYKKRPSVSEFVKIFESDDAAIKIKQVKESSRLI